MMSSVSSARDVGYMFGEHGEAHSSGGAPSLAADDKTLAPPPPAEGSEHHNLHPNLVSHIVILAVLPLAPLLHSDTQINQCEFIGS
jgi:hypothetical protein